MAISDQELKVVDRFFQDKGKTLDGPHPDWKESSRGDWEARWPIIETDKITRAHLRFRVSMGSHEYPSIMVIFRDNCVTRLDRVKNSICEQNPISAIRLGLPPSVCGTHIHSWPDNRSFVRIRNRWELPVRRPVEDNMKRLKHMFYWFSNEIGITLTPEQRGFDIPKRTLFD